MIVYSRTIGDWYNVEHTEKHKSQITFLHRVYKQICDFIIKQSKNIYRISHFCKSIPPSDHTSHFLCFIALIAEPLFPTSLRGGESTLGINYFCVNVICDLCRWSTRASRICVNYTNLCRLTQIFTPVSE